MSFLDSINSEIILDKNQQFESFYDQLVNFMNKCMYRKVIDEIEMSISKFENLRFFWRIQEVKIRSILKIIYRKIFKHEFNNNKKRNIENWLIKLEKEFDIFSHKIETSEGDHKICEDICLELFLNLLYCNGLFKKNERDLFECIGFLALGEKIIKERLNSDCKFINPNILSIGQKIILLLTTIHISNADFESAIAYQLWCLNLCHKELFLRVNLNEPINILLNTERNKLIKLFLNIFLTFYHRGIIEENLGNYNLALDCYLSAKWFSLKFLIGTNPELAQFITDVEIRFQNYWKVFYKSIKIKQDEKKNTIIKNSNPFKTETENLEKKYQRSIKQIQLLKFNNIEFPNDNRNSDYINELTYSLKIASKLMNNNVKEILVDIDQLNLHNLNKENGEKIQKKLNSVDMIDKFHILRKSENHKSTKFFKTTRSHLKSELELFREKKSLNIDLMNLKEKNLSEYFPNLNKRNISNSNRNEILSTTISNNNGISFQDLKSNRKKIIQVSEIEITNKFEINSNFKFVMPDKVFDYLKNNNSFKNTTQPCDSNNKNVALDIKNNYKDNSCREIILKEQISVKSKKNLKSWDTIEKFNYCGYITNKNFQKKITTLDKLCEKEIDFQKQLLKIKKNEIIPVNIKIDFKKQVSQDLHNKIKTFNSTKDNTTNQINKDNLIKNKLENKIIRSLNVKHFKEYRDFIRKRSKTNVKLRKEFLNLKSQVFEDAQSILRKNLEDLKKTEDDIKLINILEKKIENKINPERKSVIKRKSIVKNPKVLKSINNFINCESLLNIS